MTPAEQILKLREEKYQRRTIEESRADLAKEFYVTGQTIALWEKGAVMPPWHLRTLDRLIGENAA